MSCIEEVNAEVLIGLVKAHPVIWNIGSEEYNDKSKRYMAWDKISKQIVEDMEEKEDQERREIVKKLTIRWRNIRDTYFKSVKKRSRKGKSAGRGRQYIYARHLSFMKALVGSVETESSMDNIAESVDAPEEVRDGISIEPEQPSTLNSTHSNATRRAIITPGQRSWEIENSLLKFISEPITTPPPDEDEAFFNSLLPLVRKLNDDQKLDFRIEVTNSLKRIRQRSV